LGDGHGVFEVVGYAVDGEGAGFFEEAHGGAGDCRGVSWGRGGVVLFCRLSFWLHL
jgi:hypothetical protein